MTSNRSLVISAVLAGLVLLVVAVLYLADCANNVPTFLRGHEAGSSHHVKHGIAALAVALEASSSLGFGPRRAVARADRSGADIVAAAADTRASGRA